MNYEKAKYVGVLLFFVLIVYFLSKVFSGSIILPQTINFGFIIVHYYGIIMALAVGSSFFYAIRRSEYFGIDKRTAEDLMFWLVIGGFIGARLYHVASSIGYYFENPTDIFKVWNGGLSIYGAVLGGLGALLLYFKIFNLKSSILNLLDWLAPSLLLGQIIGRFGNLFNYEAFGYPTSLPWKMYAPMQFRPELYQNFNFFHPFFLYELLGNLIILGLLLKIQPKKSAGRLFFYYVLLYNSLRFCLEFLRIDSTFVYGIRLNAAVSLALVLCSIVVLIYDSKRIKIP